MSENIEIERFIQLSDFPLYEASSFGYIRNMSSGKRLKSSPNQSGITMVGLRHLGRTHIRSVATIICTEFNGEPPESTLGMTYSPLPIDHDRSNCSASNLIWRPRWYVIKYLQEWKRGCNFYIKVMHKPTATVYDSAFEAGHSHGMLEKYVLDECNIHTIHGDKAGTPWMFYHE